MNRLILIWCLLLILGFQWDDSYKAARKNMVDSQIKARGICDALTLAAIGSVPMHKFVPKSKISLAYNDSPQSIGYGQTISQPYIVAFMTEIIKPKKDYRI